MAVIEYPEWLREKAAAGLGSLKLKQITRGRQWSEENTITPDDPAIDLTAGVIEMNFAYIPNDGASRVFSATVGTVTESSGSYVVPLSLTSAQTALIAADADGDQITHLYWDMQFTPTGQGPIDVQAGYVPVLGKA